MKTDREAAARLANLEYEILAVIGALDLLGDKALLAGLPQRKALTLRCEVLSMRDHLQQHLLALDESITRSVQAAEAA